MRCHLRREVDRGRAVRTADDADGACLLCIEAEKHRAEESDEHADLSGSTHQESRGTRNQRTEVRHCTDAEKDQRGENLVLDTETDRGHDARLLKAVERNVRQDTAECDRAEEQRLEVTREREVEQDETDNDHDDVAGRHSHESAAVHNGLQGDGKCIDKIHNLSLPPQRDVRMPLTRP